MRNAAWPNPQTGEKRTLQGCFPGAARWGVMGGINLDQAEFECPACGHTNELVVWYGADADLEIGHRECFKCWHQGSVQLSLDFNNDDSSTNTMH